MLLRLTLARSLAWLLLIGGWVGLGSFAIVLAPNLHAAFGVVAAWLLALGVAATVATRDALRPATRRAALVLGGLVTGVALQATVRGGGMGALLVAVLAWAVLTALASGVVRSLRLAQRVPPGAPIGAASLGAAAAALLLLDLGDLGGLALRLGGAVIVATVALAALQPGNGSTAPASRCRAGLFDCSLPAWPAGAWHDVQQWPTLLAGVAMLPLMATLPLMAEWCRARGIEPDAMVVLHLGAMFGPPLLLQRAVASWSLRMLSTVCAACLASGALAALAIPAPYGLLALAAAQGAAWGLAWLGQLWAPQRRSRAGTSPLRPALGYAALTVGFGFVVASLGIEGVILTHAVLGVLAAVAWLLAVVTRARGRDVETERGAVAARPASTGSAGAGLNDVPAPRSLPSSR